MSTRTSGKRLEERGHALDAALPRHHDVHEHDVGLRLESLEDCTLRVRSLPDRLDVVFRVEHAAEAGADDGMIVDDQHPDAHSGISTAIVVPALPVSTRRRPPTRATRSRIPVRPRPAVDCAAVETLAVVLDHEHGGVAPFA